MADPVIVDSNHYKVEFENDQVRVLRIKYGPERKIGDARPPGWCGGFFDRLRWQLHFPRRQH